MGYRRAPLSWEDSKDFLHIPLKFASRALLSRSVPSCPMMPRPVVFGFIFFPVVSDLVQSYPALFCRVLCCPVLSCPFLPCLVSSCLRLCCLVWSCLCSAWIVATCFRLFCESRLLLPSLPLSFPLLPFLFLSSSLLSYPFLFFVVFSFLSSPVLSCLVPSFLILSCPVMSFLVLSGLICSVELVLLCAFVFGPVWAVLLSP